MSQWFMITLVGKDQTGIVAKITTALFDNNCNLGEASMLRLGGNFTVMLMVSYDGKVQNLTTFLQPISDSLQLQLHIDAIDGQLHHHQQPNLRIRVHGADRTGIVAQVTTALAEVGFNILDLESDVGGTDNKPFYVVDIEGIATNGIEPVETAMQGLLGNEIEIKLEPIETVMM
ncbi:ACT domain-containing protein [Candidatus Halobeggiatoa sp. HSG11]|nr:ACT domain-containing protein [Candidatus Halobeggiatoa sp. HSG11]